jgi:hypothetical protein
MNFPQVMDDVQPVLLLDSFCALVDQPRVYPIVDDVGGVLAREARSAAEEALRGWAQARGAEARLATTLLDSLPSPRTDLPWDVIADVRSDLVSPLRRFRRALVSISTEATVHPLSNEFGEYSVHVWRTQVEPALALSVQ